MTAITKRRILLIDDQASIHDDYRKIICADVLGDEQLSEAERELFGEARAPADVLDLSEVRQCAAALAERWTVARTDPLTGLLNRRSYEEQLRREWADALRYDRPLACVMIDVDFFKSINDRYGHHAGDETLRLLAGVIAGQTRPGDTLCRYGGEEF